MDDYITGKDEHGSIMFIFQRKGTDNEWQTTGLNLLFLSFSNIEEGLAFYLTHYPEVNSIESTIGGKSSLIYVEKCLKQLLARQIIGDLAQGYQSDRW